VSKKEDFVRKRFSEAGEHYSDVAGFLKSLGLLRVARSRARLVENVVGAEDELKSRIVHRLLDRNTAFSAHLNAFFAQFQASRAGWQIMMDSGMRRRFCGIRNLLLELEFLDHDFDGVRYWIAAPHLPTFLQTRGNSSVGPGELRQFADLREKLGRDAELEVMRYEAERLQDHPGLVRSIRHVALEDVGAGFDISSFTLSADGRQFIPRLIEVKAVSPYDFRFFWSRNEIETARVHRANYFLYLLPVSKAGFEIQKVRIIQNAFAEVYSKRSLWLRREEVVSFRPAALHGRD